MKTFLRLSTRNGATLKGYLLLLFFVFLVLSSCNTSEAPVIKPIEAAAWSKFDGKLISASNALIFSFNSKTRSIDTLHRRPSSISYQIYGAFGMEVSYDKSRIIYSVYGGFNPQWGKVFSMRTDGSNNVALLPNPAIMLSAAVENSVGSVAYFTGDYYQEASNLWIDDKKIYDFKLGPYGNPSRFKLDWHPKENLLLMSLGDYKEGVWTCSLYGIQLPNIDVKPILLAPAGSCYVSASYSPDGKKIVFLSFSNLTSKGAICSVNSDGAEFMKIADAVFDSYPVWSPDGKKIAYTSNNGIYVANADGSEASLVCKGYAARLIWLQE